MVSKNSKQVTKARDQILKWYLEHRRPLPWRAHSDPYKIWISEVMLQQTTVQAVIPFYERFMERFPELKDLALASLEDVYEYWAGLGYYSRARNLHKAAKHMYEHGVPQSHTEFLELPGFGPYTARAVASLAFNEKVGVVDGNVIRVFSRFFGEEFQWWKSKDKNHLQSIADQLAQTPQVKDLNQALMELGATVCTSKSPACLLCPWSRDCAARKNDTVDTLPLKKPKKAKEIWQWNIWLAGEKGKVAFTNEKYTPFLRQHSLFPGKVKRLTKAPKTFDYKHLVTHYEIYVKVEKTSKAKLKDWGTSIRWISKTKVSREIPLSIINKALEVSDI